MCYKYVLLTFGLIAFSCRAFGHPLVESSQYTKSCANGRFQTKKLTTAMKVNRFSDVINGSSILSANLMEIQSSKWYEFTSSAHWDMPKLHNKITKQSSFEMIHQDLQKYLATVHLIIKTKRSDSIRQNKMISDFKGFLEDIHRIMCAVEGVINGTNAELDSQKTKYKYIHEEKMNKYLEEIHKELKHKPLVVGTSILDQLTEFTFLIQEIAKIRLNKITKNQNKKSKRNKEGAPLKKTRGKKKPSKLGKKPLKKGKLNKANTKPIRKVVKSRN